MELLVEFIALVRKELTIQCTDLTHFVALLLMPLLLMLLLTHALRGSFAPGLGSTAVPVAGDARVVNELIGDDVHVSLASERSVRDDVRDGRRLVGLIQDHEGIRVIVDPAFPMAAHGMYQLLSKAGLNPVAEDPRGRSVDLTKDLSPFNYTVPGLAIMFLFFLAVFTGFSFYGDVASGAWLRLKASQVPSSIIVAGKIVGSVIVGLLQLMILFGIGRLVLGLKFQWIDIPGMLAIFTAVALVATTFGVMLTALTRTAQQLNLLIYLFVLLFASIGGAIVPIAGLPRALQDLSVFTPHYWAIRGLRDIMFRGMGYESIPGNIWPLLAEAVIFFAIGITTFRYSRLSKVVY